MFTGNNKTVVDLLDKVKAGDTSAFDKIVALYQKPLFGYMKVRIYGYQEADLEDLSQIIWLDVLKKTSLPYEDGGYDPKASAFYTYLTRRVAEYSIKQWFDRKKKGREFLVDINDQAINALSDTDIPERVYELEEEMHLRVYAYQALFRLVFLCGGYPHQQLAFGFAKLVYGKQSNRALEGRILDFYNSNKTYPLSYLLNRFKKEYASASFFEQEELERIYLLLRPVEIRLELAVKELMQYDGISLDYHGDIAAKLVKDTSIKEYCEKDGKEKSGKEISDTISNWCYRLKKRLKNIITVDSIDDLSETEILNGNQKCGYCNLKKIPPCSDIFPAKSDISKNKR
ncbi:MAG: hypothetical protein PHO15_10230 [Eubacteriales bacterium]|nr:hypothetical protein [Eubacteriales bacterium]